MASLFTDDSAAAVATVQVAVERGVDRYPDGLTYALPADLGDLAIGERVVVPLGRGNTPTHGYVIDRTADGAAEPSTTLKSVLRRDRDGLRLPHELVALARWIATYYCCPIGMTLAGMLPAAVKKGIGRVTRVLVDLPSADEAGSAAPGAAVAAPPSPTTSAPVAARRPSPKQRRVLEILAGLDASERPVEMRRLAALAELATTSPIRRLVERGDLVLERVGAVEAAWREEAVDPAPPPALTADQHAAVEAIGATLGTGFSSHLLFGVTGSGKTEVYLRLIDRTVAAGQVAVVLVPEISLTPQTGGRLVRRLPGRRVAILHSGLTAAQRHHQWALVAEGRADVILGARSAAFAPVPDGRLGLIVVDEEHDGSYKQDQAPRYHGRDVALRRGQLAGTTVLLGSATPSLESWHNATRRSVHRLHRLPDRAPGLRLPAVRIVDFAEETRARRRQGNDRRLHLLGPTLEEAIGRTLAPDGDRTPGQVLLLLNRRGYANYIACADHSCGWMLECEHCDATMVCHRDQRVRGGSFVRCHHCQAERQLPGSCPRCEGRITVFGLGTQRVEEELSRKFPLLETGRTMLRVDSDTMHRATDLHDALHRFGAGELRLLLGTQMIAKGLDFPGVRLVGVVNGDTAISLPDFRAGERTFQLISQVAGRCGRGADPGLAIIQTFNPMLPPIELAARHDYETFASRELVERDQCGLPPGSRMIRFVLRDEDPDRCAAIAASLADGLRELSAETAPASSAGGDPGLRVLGPAPCPIARVAGRYRQQVEAIAAGAGPLQQLLAAGRDRGLIRPGEGLAVDVDPVAML